MLHDLDWTTRLVGEPVAEIVASGSKPSGAYLDEVEADLRFEGGCVVRLYASRVAVERRRDAFFVGSSGEAKADLDCAQRRFSVDRTPPHSPADLAIDESRGRDPLESQWIEFIGACRERRQPSNSGQVGVDALRLVERVRDAVGRTQGMLASYRHHPSA